MKFYHKTENTMKDNVSSFDWNIFGSFLVITKNINERVQRYAECIFQDKKSCNTIKQILNIFIQQN